MGRKTKKSVGLGRQLINEHKKGPKRSNGSWLHTSELSGPEATAYGVTSVTEESSLDAFLRTAQLAGTEFAAEKLDISVVADTDDGLPSQAEAEATAIAQEENTALLTIPRRPPWNADMSAEELDQKETESFLEWRRGLAKLQEVKALTLTPFEKNLAFWRQLWRVIERSHLIVQIVDARNPLLFHCKDLTKYVKEIDPDKQNLLLLNKSDLLTPHQRAVWFEYFTKQDFNVAFFSALEESRKMESTDDDSDSEEENSDSETDSETNSVSETAEQDNETEESRVLSREELIDLFKSFGSKAEDKVLTVGMVGYPNVGKSSTINCLLQTKRVPVSATPGRTKHFQTLFMDKSLCLCDCPGLVFPSFLSTKAEMVCSGILPIDHMREHVGPVSLVCQRISRRKFERTYGFYLVQPPEGEDPDRPPHADELLKAYGYLRGFMTSHGQPDGPRSSRYILKDYVTGKLLYCHPPPDVDAGEFNASDVDENELKLRASGSQEHGYGISKRPRYVNAVDESFFNQDCVGAISKGVHGMKGFARRGVGFGDHSTSNVEMDETASVSSKATSVSSKPWKKHQNRNKKEKTRRLQAKSVPDRLAYDVM